jgi:hypothetical protein
VKTLVSLTLLTRQPNKPKNMINRQELIEILETIASILKSTSGALDTQPTEPAATGKRGRPRKAAEPTGTDSKPEEQNTAQQPATTAPAEQPKGYTPEQVEENLKELRAAFDPLIKAAKGILIKPVLNKHAPADFKPSGPDDFYTATQLASRPDDVRQAFMADIKKLVAELPAAGL